ncbi:hypothetical protein BKI52_27215 [marine bacterium AO1-C]|nr:hypothetical protein BKI52_27215 [marine bacterium AO1-C]
MKKQIILGIALVLILGAIGSFVYYDYHYAPKRTLTFLPKKTLKVAIQPFKGTDKGSVLEVKKGIERYYGLQVTILPDIPLPAHAKNTHILKKYHLKLPVRYRADSLIAYLWDTKPPAYDYIIGLTNQDISTTKPKKPKWLYTDWGIFGLGYRPGPTCIVSTYRLYRYANLAQMRTRLRKIAIHELGHNLNLKHCPHSNCVMQSARESMKTIDTEPESLCDSCKNIVKRKFIVNFPEEQMGKL